MTPLELTDTLTRQKETVLPDGVSRERLVADGHPADAPPLRLYTCGPTVYNLVHVGNLRAFVFYDVLRRGLEWLGYRVRHVMNLTDVDDKTIRGARAASLPLREFTQRYVDAFLADMRALNVLQPHALPRATDAINAMVRMVEDLLAKGHAYRSDDGSVYFKIASFEGYGKLSHLERRTLQAGAGGRVAADEYDKESAQDFALWKAWTPEDGDVYWETSLGKGRPGWHLECSALAMEHLGETIDIHAGGVDLVFPHHENEIAQSEATTGRTFARYWAHNEHLLVGGQKMSKSLGNFYTFAQLQELAGATGRELRYALISAHYKKQLNLQVTYEGEGAERRAVRFDSIEAAREALARLDQFRASLLGRGGEGAPEGGRERLAQTRAEIERAIADDLNVSQALARLFELVKEVNKVPPFDDAFGREVIALLDDVDRVLGVLQPEVTGLSAEEQALFDRWVAAREAKDWAAADAVREELKAQGVQVQARKGESTWTRV